MADVKICDRCGKTILDPLDPSTGAIGITEG